MTDRLNWPPSTFLDRHRELADALAAIDHEHAAADEWREARRQAMGRTLLLAMRAYPAALDDQERRTLRWLTEQDVDMVAGVAALLDRARERKGRHTDA